MQQPHKTLKSSSNKRAGIELPKTQMMKLLSNKTNEVKGSKRIESHKLILAPTVTTRMSAKQALYAESNESLERAKVLLQNLFRS